MIETVSLVTNMTDIKSTWVGKNIIMLFGSLDNNRGWKQERLHDIWLINGSSGDTSVYLYEKYQAWYHFKPIYNIQLFFEKQTIVTKPLKHVQGVHTQNWTLFTTVKGTFSNNNIIKNKLTLSTLCTLVCISKYSRDVNFLLQMPQFIFSKVLCEFWCMAL